MPGISQRVLKKQEMQKNYHDSKAHSRELGVGDKVYVVNFCPGAKWLPGVIVQKSGSVSFKVELLDGRTVRRHLDYVRRRERLEEEDGTTDDLSPPAVNIAGAASGVSEQGSELSSFVPPSTASGRSSDGPPLTTGENEEHVLAHPNNVPIQLWKKQPGHGSEPRQPPPEQPSGNLGCRSSERLRKKPDSLQITWD